MNLEIWQRIFLRPPLQNLCFLVGKRDPERTFPRHDCFPIRFPGNRIRRSFRLSIIRYSNYYYGYLVWRRIRPSAGTCGVRITIWHRSRVELEFAPHTYEILDRPRYIAFRVDEHNCHVAHGAGWSRAEALADGRRQWPYGDLSTTVATPDLMISTIVRGMESVSFTEVVGELAVRSGERRTYTDEYWDYRGTHLGLR